MRRSLLAAGLFTLSLLAGCLAIPVPLSDATHETVYAEPGNEFEIIQTMRRTYLPMLASAEGSGKFWVGTNSYSYEVRSPTMSKPLPFLACSDGGGDWSGFARLSRADGIICAYRLLRHRVRPDGAWELDYRVMAFSVERASGVFEVTAVMTSLGDGPTLSSDGIFDYPTEAGRRRIDIRTIPNLGS